MNFRNKTPNADKLLKYGFELSGGKYVYRTPIVDGQMMLTVTVENGELSTEVYDTAAEEAYTLHLVEHAVGAFVGRVRAECEAAVRDVEQSCFDFDAFKEDYTRQILQYCKDKYGNEPEYLWTQYPEYAVLRRLDKQKWYAILMRVPQKRLGLDGEETVEIIDLRFDTDELPQKIDNQSFFAGYHMNKKHWITILLDGLVPLSEMLEYVDKSYNLAKK